MALRPRRAGIEPRRNASLVFHLCRDACHCGLRDARISPPPRRDRRAKPRAGHRFAARMRITRGAIRAIPTLNRSPHASFARTCEKNFQHVD
jgi:hypothetical protein